MTSPTEPIPEAGPSSSGLLTRLSASPSPSTSSLTTSSSFDPHEPYEEAPKSGHGSRPQPQSQILGLRELARMRKAEREVARRSKKEGQRSQLETSVSGNKRPNQVRLTSSVIGPGTDLPFTNDVEIKGWRVVGGKSWTDLGRIGAYVVYDIEITLRSGGKINILRRYTDFVNLRSALETRYPAFTHAIPPLPGKAHMSRFSDKFLSERQPRLQRFLRGVLLHPEMGRAGERSVAGKWVVDADARADG